MTTTPKTTREQFLELLHQVIQHSPLKLEETNGTDYDKGYIAYQNMVISDVNELETTMWDFWQAKLDEAVKAERERCFSLIRTANNRLIELREDGENCSVIKAYIFSAEMNELIKAISEPTDPLPTNK